MGVKPSGKPSISSYFVTSFHWTPISSKSVAKSQSSKCGTFWNIAFHFSVLGEKYSLKSSRSVIMVKYETQNRLSGTWVGLFDRERSIEKKLKILEYCGTLRSIFQFYRAGKCPALPGLLLLFNLTSKNYHLVFQAFCSTGEILILRVKSQVSNAPFHIASAASRKSKIGLHVQIFEIKL